MSGNLRVISVVSLKRNKSSMITQCKIADTQTKPFHITKCMATTSNFLAQNRVLQHWSWSCKALLPNYTDKVKKPCLKYAKKNCHISCNNHILPQTKNLIRRLMIYAVIEINFINIQIKITNQQTGHHWANLGNNCSQTILGTIAMKKHLTYKSSKSSDLWLRRHI